MITNIYLTPGAELSDGTSPQRKRRTQKKKEKLERVNVCLAVAHTHTYLQQRNKKIIKLNRSEKKIGNESFTICSEKERQRFNLIRAKDGTLGCVTRTQRGIATQNKTKQCTHLYHIVHRAGNTNTRGGERKKGTMETAAVQETLEG